MLANNALTTLEKAKSYLAIPSEDVTQDDILTFFINSASTTIEKYCNRVFGLKTFNELLQGRGSSKLILDNYPIVTVAEVLIDDQSVDISGVKVLSDKGMIYRPGGGFPAIVQGGRFLHPRPDEHHHNIFVEYTAGYVLPKDESTENPRTLPFDLELACLRMLSTMQKGKDVVSNGTNLILKREQIGDWIGEYEPEIRTTASVKIEKTDFDILSILDLYKRAEYGI